MIKLCPCHKDNYSITEKIRREFNPIVRKYFNFDGELKGVFNKFLFFIIYAIFIIFIYIKYIRFSAILNINFIIIFW